MNNSLYLENGNGRDVWVSLSIKVNRNFYVFYRIVTLMWTLSSPNHSNPYF